MLKEKFEECSSLRRETLGNRREQASNPGVFPPDFGSVTCDDIDKGSDTSCRLVAVHDFLCDACEELIPSPFLQFAMAVKIAVRSGVWLAEFTPLIGE